jgi:transcriptional regulator with XRE-family HTH domain
MARTTAQRTAKRVLLGHEITYLRARLGMSQTELGKAINKPQGKIALLETGEATVTADQLVLIMNKLEVQDEDHRAAIVNMHTDSHKRGEWTTGHNRAYGESLRLLIDLERHADQIFTATFEIVPGLLQSQGYIRSLCARNRLQRGITADMVVNAWQERQGIITKLDAPVVHLVLSESCLRRKWGNAAVMYEQMEHLLVLSHHPNVRLQVLTFDSSEEDLTPVGHGYTLLRVPTAGRAGDLHIAYNEGVKEMYYRDEPGALDAHQETKAELIAAAYNPEDSRQFISYMSGVYRKAMTRSSLAPGGR